MTRSKSRTIPVVPERQQQYLIGEYMSRRMSEAIVRVVGWVDPCPPAPTDWITRVPPASLRVACGLRWHRLAGKPHAKTIIVPGLTEQCAN